MKWRTRVDPSLWAHACLPSLATLRRPEFFQSVAKVVTLNLWDGYLSTICLLPPVILSAFKAVQLGMD